MGAKFTIVLDTDDPQGLRDALEIATLLNKNHHTSVQRSISERSHLSSWCAMLPGWWSGKQDSSLRDSKGFVDERWDNFGYRN